MNRKTHTISVVIETDDAQSESRARERMHSWLETYGHTASAHGFTFLETQPAPKGK